MTTNPPKPASSTRRPGGASVVKLAVHKNTKLKRRSKDLRDKLVLAVRDEHGERPLSGYIVIFVGTDGKLAVEMDGVPHPVLRNAADALSFLATQQIATEVINVDEGDEDQQP